ncbi:unnamed protein product, partial [Ectocarpus fasciculatus]
GSHGDCGAAVWLRRENEGNLPKGLRRDASPVAPARLRGREHPREEGLRASCQGPGARAPHRPLARVQDRRRHDRGGYPACGHGRSGGPCARGGDCGELLRHRGHRGCYPE